MENWNDGTELYHHGIKGMKWGVRRFQNKDGSLTPAGRKRYDDGSDKKRYNIPEHTKKSTHRQRLEKKYMEKKGMSLDEAEQAAAKRIRTEKFLAAAAVTSVAAVTAAYAHKRYNTELIISKDTEFQRIMNMKPDAEILKGGRDYVSFDEKDKTKYKGLLGKSFQDAIDRSRAIDERLDLPKDQWDTSRVENVTIKYKNDLKVASPKMSRETFANLYRENPEFRESFESANRNLANTPGKIGDLGEKVRDKLGKGKVSDTFLKTKAYEAFNVDIADKSKEAQKAQKIYFDELKKKGVQAIEDINDKKYSGYGAKRPLIVFDDEYDIKRTELGRSEIEKNYKKAYAEINAKELGKIGAKYALAYGAGKLGINALNRKTVIDSYKKEHPDTKLTNDEIYKKVVDELKQQSDQAPQTKQTKPAKQSKEKQKRKVKIGPKPAQTITLDGQTFKIYGNPNNNSYVKAINQYKKDHPDSKMSDDEIYRMLFKK